MPLEGPLDEATRDAVQESAFPAPALSQLRAAEKILIAYFLYIALLASIRALSAASIALAWLTPAAISAALWGALRHRSKWSALLRDWIPLLLILVGYWELQW